MTWANRVRLYGGMLLVLLLVAALVLVFNQRRSQALSVTGPVVTAEARIGALYGGVVVDQQARVGDTVHEGQALVTVAVPQLGERSWSSGRGAPSSTDAYTVDADDGTVTYRALASGVVLSVSGTEGSYVQDGAELGRISATGSQEAVAEFVLSPRDYDRIEPGASVSLRLPDDSTVPGSVRTVSVTTDAALAKTRVTIASPGLRDPSIARLTVPGTPLAATLSLRDDGPLAGPSDIVVDLLHKVGVA